MLLRVKDISEWSLKRFRKEYPEEGLTHALWETEDKMFGFYFYNITEYGINKDCSKLQILRDKLNPSIIYDSNDLFFLYNIYESFFEEYDWTDKGLLYLRLLLDRGFNAPVVIINLANLKFVMFNKFHVKCDLKNNILTMEEAFYNKVDKSERKETESIDLNKIEWTSLNKMPSAINKYS